MSIPLSDADEWRAVLAGDGEAFARIFDRHSQRVYRHSLAMVPAADDAQDVVGVTFLEAWRKRGDVRFVNGSLLPWLLVTASHSSKNISRAARRYRNLLEHVPRPESQAGPELMPDDGAAMTALRDLGTHHRDVIALCVIEGFSEAEAAEALGVPVGTVKSRLHRAKQTLASRLRQDITPDLLAPATSRAVSSATDTTTTDSIEMSDSR